MARIAVCGGSVVGLSTAMMLAADGHDVTVFEADPDGAPTTPADAWMSWSRRGVAQFHQPHTLLTRFRRVCDQELPGLTERLLATGCVWVDYLAALPPGVTDRAPRPGDADMRTITGRRPVVEAVVASAAQEHPRVEIRRGARVVGLLPGPAAVPGVPHAGGVELETGERVAADLVVDAMGRRTRTTGWLAELGARPPVVEAEDRGFVYYTRFFTGPDRPQSRAPALMPMGSFSLLTLYGDNDTWSVTLYALTGDAPLKAVRDPDVFTRIVAACPQHAHWLDGTPITDVLAMAGIMDRYRRFVVDDQPVVTGFAAVGDAWACTNPSAGRGLSVGLLHAQVLRGAVRDGLADPAAFARDWDARTEQVVTPYYRNQIAADRARIVEMDAARNGLPAPASDSMMGRLLAVAGRDADAFRALMETVTCVALPQEVFARPGMAERISRLSAARQPSAPPAVDRQRLLQLIDA